MAVLNQNYFTCDSNLPRTAFYARYLWLMSEEKSRALLLELSDVVADVINLLSSIEYVTYTHNVHLQKSEQSIRMQLVSCTIDFHFLYIRF